MHKDYSDSDYYWEKAEFQDPVAHRQHVENYKKGIRSSIFFDKQYSAEAAEEISDIRKILTNGVKHNEENSYTV